LDHLQGYSAFNAGYAVAFRLAISIFLVQGFRSLAKHAQFEALAKILGEPLPQIFRFFLFLAPADRLESVKGAMDDIRARYSAVMKKHGAFEMLVVGVHTTETKSCCRRSKKHRLRGRCCWNYRTELGGFRKYWRISH
jgi:hypothetical protein